MIDEQLEVVPEFVIEALGSLSDPEETPIRKCVTVLEKGNQRIRILLSKSVTKINAPARYLVLISVDEKNSANISWNFSKRGKRERFIYTISSLVEGDHDQRKSEEFFFDFLSNHATDIFEYFLWNRI